MFDFSTRPFVFINIRGLIAENQLSATLIRVAGDPDVWGLSPWAFGPRKLMKNGRHSRASGNPP